jgi:Flp pilus assembly protein TadD
MQKKKSLWCVVAAALLVSLASGGCAASKKKQSREAQARWNHARANVMASLANDQYKAGAFDACRKTLTDALKMDPRNPRLHLLSGRLALEQGQLELAERELELTRKFAPNEPEGYFLAGVIYQRWQKPERAYEFYTAAADKNPIEIQYLLARAEMLVEMDRQGEALTLLQGKVQYYENNAAIRDAVGQLLMQAKRYSEAAALFREASVLEDGEPGFKERLGLAMFYDRQYADAIDVLSKLVQREGYTERADLLCALGESQLQMSMPRDARQSFDLATRHGASNIKAWLGLGRAAMEVKDFRRAELALKKAQTMDDKSTEAQLLTGYLRLRQGKMRDALAAFQQASKLDPKDSVAVSMIGYVYEKSGKPDVAAKYYGKALKLNPNDPLASKLMAGVNLND